MQMTPHACRGPQISLRSCLHLLQRIGDTTAAALFQTLVPALGFGPSELAMAVVPVTAAWAAAAYSLGRRQQQLARSQFLAQ